MTEIPPMPSKSALRVMSNRVLSYMIKRSPSTLMTNIFEEFSPNFKETKELNPVLLHTLAMLEKGQLIKIDNKYKTASSATFVLCDDKGKPIPYESIDDDFKSPTFGNWITIPYEKVIHPMCHEHFQNGFPVPGCSECEKEILGTICQAHNNPLRRCKKCQAFTDVVKEIVEEKDSKLWISEQIKTRKAKNLEDFQK